MHLQSKCGRFVTHGLLCAQLCLLLFMTQGCASMARGDKAKEGLAAAAVQFNNALRWNDGQEAAVWIPQALRGDYWTQMDAMQKKIRLMEYEIRDVVNDEATGSGTVIVHCKYYKMDNPTVKDVMLRQTWLYEEKTKSWKVVKTDIETLLTNN